MTWGKWQCTNPECQTRQDGILVFSSDPAYADKKCDRCGFRLRRISGPDGVYLYDSAPFTPHVRPAGALPVVWAEKPNAIHADRLIARISDPDIPSYPELKDAERDPSVLHPSIFEYLEVADVFLARSASVPKATIVARCASHHLAIPLARIPFAALHVEVHNIDGIEVFGVYPLLWDNCTTPWYVEARLLPYDQSGVTDQELSPRFAGYEWRQLFYLLTQTTTPLILLDENDTVIGVRELQTTRRQEHVFRALLQRLVAIQRRRISKQEALHAEYRCSRTIPMEQIVKRCPPLEEVCIPELYVGDAEDRIMACSGCGQKNRIRFHLDLGTCRCGSCKSVICDTSDVWWHNEPLAEYPVFEEMIKRYPEETQTDLRRTMDGVPGRCEIYASYKARGQLTTCEALLDRLDGGYARCVVVRDEGGQIYIRAKEPSLRSYLWLIEALSLSSSKLYECRNGVVRSLAELEVARAFGRRAYVAGNYCEKGRACCQEGKWEEAIASYSKAIELDPRRYEAYANRGYSWMQLGKHSPALADYNCATDLAPYRYELYRNRAKLLHKVGMLSEALADCDKLVAFKPDLCEGYLARASVLEALGRDEEALQDLGKGIELNPSNGEGHNNRCLILFRRRRLEEALADINKAIEADPACAEFYCNRGAICQDMAKPTEALADYSKAIELNPGCSYAYYGRGRILYGKAEIDAALADFDKAIELSPEFGEAYGYRGRIWQSRGAGERAEVDLRKAEELRSRD